MFAGPTPSNCFQPGRIGTGWSVMILRDAFLGWMRSQTRRVNTKGDWYNSTSGPADPAMAAPDCLGNLGREFAGPEGFAQDVMLGVRGQKIRIAVPRHEDNRHSGGCL